MGIYWNTQTDNIGYQLKVDILPNDVIRGKQLPTKRQVLAFVMSVYDPIGLISDLTIHGRILMQELHKATVEWDNLIPQTLLQQWMDWLQIIKTAENLSIPRCVQINPWDPVEIHVFVDASEKAYAAAVYVKSQTQTSTSVRLLMGKARVAPSKPLSIPRLELEAAMLGVRLLDTVKEETRLEISRVIFWTDSKTVLGWIQSDYRTYNRHIARRIGEILDTTAIDQWRWVPSKENPADEATKHIKGGTKWLHGPEFLKYNEQNWPTLKEITIPTEEMRNLVSVHNESTDFEFIQEDRYSSWWKLVFHLCLMKKYVDWLIDKRTFKKAITLNDRRIVENALYRKAQWTHYSQEIKDLQKNGQVSNRSSLSEMTPYLDEYGVMRGRTRLELVEHVRRNARIPIILPQLHRITKLIVRHMHEKYLHQARQSVKCAIRQKWQVVNLDAVLKKRRKLLPNMHYPQG